jgi:glycosyltransferase involved in cell wall biosynthesis
VPYKRVDLAVQAFNRLGYRLLIVGEGPEKSALTRLAQKNIEFIPWQRPEDLKKYYSDCRALVFPGEEDFGIVPVEGQACGKPVIAFGRGGVLETVAGVFPEETFTSKKKPTGVFFREQKIDSLQEAVRILEKTEFDPVVIRQNSMRFSSRIFKEKMKEFVDRKIEEHRRVFNL